VGLLFCAPFPPQVYKPASDLTSVTFPHCNNEVIPIDSDDDVSKINSMQQYQLPSMQVPFIQLPCVVVSALR
jgi:hypothetical protein